MCQRQLFRKISQNADYVKTHCNDVSIPFHFLCRKWYLYKNPLSSLPWEQIYNLL